MTNLKIYLMLCTYYKHFSYYTTVLLLLLILKNFSSNRHKYEHKNIVVININIKYQQDTGESL